ncbi:MAG: hypothetical protein GTO45_33920 [Candidatus Aminicenantes bacterium]|nr:hypothetical protein [Candidatus Aminicenantes bacterium]NIM83707.1 hypothetical protein [Candidatus Aminicenantes bacterium]NIN23132.1 hypothetical protein [Candidatus Aminicenantes bacterium]NIN46859.1 hypothetical protein [Candidatus Aminicenantes bacterium]NIN89781.1 hypothetical protein [Candidatus Aminicenantes bacterium]
MNDKEKNDRYEDLKNAGYFLAQRIYNAENTGIKGIKDLIKKYTGRLFNYIHNNKVSEFLLYLEKICASIYIQPPKETIEFLRARGTRKFREYALAFMMGFMSDKKEKYKKGGQSE